MIGRPPMHFKPASRAGSWVVSTMRGKGVFWEYSAIILAMSAASSRPANPTLTSSPWAPLRTCSPATLSVPSKSCAKSKSRNAFEPVALLRSPTKNGAGCCTRVLASNNEAIAGVFLPDGGLGVLERKVNSRARMCSGVVPQHPPKIATPSMSANLACSLANTTSPMG